MEFPDATHRPGETVPSEQFAVPESAAVTISDDDDDEVRSTVPRAKHLLPPEGKAREAVQPPTTEYSHHNRRHRVTQSASVMQ
ncbi:hypothetical protein HOLleu_41451 [Holothuria leucospilota]|uniref:Uncharacterized protein n=1 Tax=Holothuria leucospilota TaxID=206669 RepID=A0A9Q1B9N5_HOLLE|nr:hypothetical protein HOLleu_41451 [Holothuria leucospilota]